MRYEKVSQDESSTWLTQSMNLTDSVLKVLDHYGV